MLLSCANDETLLTSLNIETLRVKVTGSSERILHNIYYRANILCYILAFQLAKKEKNPAETWIINQIWRSLCPLTPSPPVIFTYCIIKPATCCWILCPCICSLRKETDPQWTNPHYSVQCLRTRGSTFDTYKWLAHAVCFRQRCCRARPDGLWSTLLWCNTHGMCPSAWGKTRFTFLHLLGSRLWSFTKEKWMGSAFHHL